MGYRKILVPLDGSKQAESVLKQVETIAASKAHVHLIYVIDGEHTPRQPFSPTAESLLKDMDFDAPESVDACETYLKRAGETLTLDGYWVTVAVRKGASADMILAEAKNANFDVIAIASHGRTGTEHAALGSVTLAVLERAKCPVLVLPSGKINTHPLPNPAYYKESGAHTAQTS